MTSPCDDKMEELLGRFNTAVARLKEESEALADDVMKDAKDIDPDIDTTGPDVWIGMDIDVKWKRQDMSLDLPNVRIVDQKWSLDVPQLTARDEDVIFHLPSIRMVRKKIGEYPEVKCEGFPPQCRVKWSPIYADLPEPYMQERRIVVVVVDIKMGRTEFAFGVPEVTMTPVNFSMNIPEITVKSISAEAKEAEDKGKALSASAIERSSALQKEFKEKLKAELGQETAGLFDCYFEDLSKQKNTAVESFAVGEAMIEGAIAGMQAQKVPEDNGTLQQLRASLADIRQNRADFLTNIEKQLGDLILQRTTFIENLMPV